MRRLVSQTSPAPKMTWFSWTPSRTSSLPAARRASSWSARAGMIASRSAPPVVELRLLDREPVGVRRRHHEPVALEATRIPVRTGRDSSRDAARATFSIVPSSAGAAIVCSVDVRRRQAREVLRAVDVEPRGVAPGGDREDAVALLVGERHRSRPEGAERGRSAAVPGTTTAPSPVTVAGDRRRAARSPCPSRRA